MLGFSGITGIDAETKKPTKINGLSGAKSNTYLGVNYTVKQPADFLMAADSRHEFTDVVEQLCGWQNKKL